MRLGIVSDVHAEFHDRKIYIPADVDVIAIAGDLANTPYLAHKTLAKIRSNTYAKIVYVLGNHEYYRHEHLQKKKKTRKNVDQLFLEYKNKCEKIEDVHVLEKEELTIDRVRFLATTLWSDLADPLNAIRAEMFLNDFGKIWADDKALTAKKYTEMFREAKAWIEKKLKEKHEKTVIVTHHCPSFYMINPEHINSEVRYCFHSELSEMILDYEPNVWVYGHDHYSNEKTIGKTLLVSHQIDYYPNDLTIKVIEV